MDLSNFFNSYIGMYVAQSFCHSVIASVISDQAIRAWNIADPAVRQRFRLIAILVPVFSFPLYQMLDRDRSTLAFRLEALFDVNRWLNMELFGAVPVGLLFLVLLAATSFVFIFQEMVPILSHTMESKNAEHGGAAQEPDPFLKQASDALSVETPGVFTLDDDEPLIFSTTGRNPAIFVSSGLSRALTPDQMQAALAHELAHIARSRRPLLLAVFFLRMVMFYNPVSLVEFRRAVRNEEKICDDIAVSLTNRPEALAEALHRFRPSRKDPEPDAGRKPLFTPTPLEEYSHTLQLDGRIARLAESTQKKGDAGWIPFALAVIVIAGINYFVV